MSTNKAHPHAELMKLYAADAAETDKPWERWEFRRPKINNRWLSFNGIGDNPHPSWGDDCEYRRKPVEPTAPQIGSWLYNPWTGMARSPQDISSDPFGKLMIPPGAEIKAAKIPEPALLQGYTMEQWRFIEEQGFDCEFSNSSDFADAKISKLTSVLPYAAYQFVSEADNPEWAEAFPYCRPRRAKGVKQPWFGGECPVDTFANVVVYRRDGRQDKGVASTFSWGDHSAGFDIIAFIEL